MVEQLTLNQRVGGSSPPRFTKLPVLFLLSRDSILSPLESVDLDIEFLAHTTTPKGWPVLSRDSILSPLESVDLDIEFLAHTTTPKGWPVLFNELTPAAPQDPSPARVVFFHRKIRFSPD